MFVASSRNDSVTAVDVTTGEFLWRSYAAGPIRLAPVGVADRLYFGSDDGSLYCLDQATGDKAWTLDPGVSRMVLGNDRLISVHPVRGSPVTAGQTLYFTTGIWPFEGTFLYSVDLAASRARPQYSVRSLRKVAPQGYLVAAGGRVLIPGGRAKVTSIDPETGSRPHRAARPGRTRAVTTRAGRAFYRHAKLLRVGILSLSAAESA